MHILKQYPVPDHVKMNNIITTITIDIQEIFPGIQIIETLPTLSERRQKDTSIRRIYTR